MLLGKQPLCHHHTHIPALFISAPQAKKSSRPIPPCLSHYPEPMTPIHPPSPGLSSPKSFVYSAVTQLRPLPISQPWVLWFSLSILSKILNFHLLPWIFPSPKPRSLLKTLLPLLSAQRWLFSFPKSMCPWPRDGGDILLAMFRPLSLPLP